jgi:hypothetical protein
LAFDSKTTSPVLTSIRETEGLFRVGEADIFLKTVAADCGSKAVAVDDVKRLAEIMAAPNPSNFFIITY